MTDRARFKMASRKILWITAVVGAIVAAWLLSGGPRSEPLTALLVVVICVVLAAAEILPAWCMTAVLWVLAPLLLWRFDSRYAPWSVIEGSMHPVLIVFLTGFAFAAAAERHGIDVKLAGAAVNLARRDHVKFVALLATTTVWLSAWISNVAAAALMFGAVRPLIRDQDLDQRQQRSLMLAIAVAANIGGMATPIGTGANAVAVAAAAPTHPVTFVRWMLFAVPLTIVLTAVLVSLAVRNEHAPREWPRLASERSVMRPLHRPTAVLFGLTVILWLSQPIHHIAMHHVAAGALALLLLTGAIGRADVRRMDWSSLALIAGGIGIGTIMDRSGAAQMLVGALPIAGADSRLVLFALCLLSAALSAVMSNTGTAAVLIPIGLALLPNTSTAILIALATALGFPFVVSTPANVMAVRYGVRSVDLLRLGLPAMVVGSALLALTGRHVLKVFGIP